MTEALFGDEHPKGLNESQRLFVLTRFTRVDDLLQAIGRLAESASSPFSAYAPDFLLDEAAQVAAIAQEVRARMLAALRDLGIESAERERSAK